MTKRKWFGMGVYCRNNEFALFTVAIDRWAFHFFPKSSKDRFWGYVEHTDYGYVLQDWGFGPFLMVCKF